MLTRSPGIIESVVKTKFNTATFLAARWIPDFLAGGAYSRVTDGVLAWHEQERLTADGARRQKNLNLNLNR